ncbi:MAG: hypothetical protein ACRDJE_06775 [Dehalococcoidia bacterium]
MSKRSLPGDNHATSRREAETDALLRESVRGSGLEGKPLHLSSMPFKQSGDSVVSGMFGPPGWAVRLKQIHDLRTELTSTLETAWTEHARTWRGRPQEFAGRWRAFVATLDLTKLNALIEKHNEWYPVEARLPIVYPTGQYHVPTGIEYPQKPVTVDALLEQYPADVDMATYFTQR